MKLRRFGAPRADESSADPAASNTPPDQQRVCPQCGALISSRAKTCLHCGADLVAIAKAEAAKVKQLQRQQQEKREEAAQIPIRIFVIIITLVVIGLILALVVQGSQEAANLALTPTVTRTPTRTPRPTSTPQPTPTTAATPTPLSPIQIVVKSGDTPGGLADLCGLSVDQFMLYNSKAVDDFIVVGEKLQCPAPTPRPTTTVTPVGFEPTATPTRSSCESVYIVQDGDTLSDIAVKLKVPMAIIQQRNNITDPEALSIGQQLVIVTCPTPTNTPAPTVDVNATPSPPANYSQVRLLTPLDGEIIVGNSRPIVLQWLSAGLLKSNELYRAEVSQVNGTRSPEVKLTLATSWRLPADLFPPASDRNRVFRWKVEIVRQVGTGSDGQPIYEVVSPLSQYSFEWLATAPTPTATPTRLPGARVTPGG